MSAARSRSCPTCPAAAQTGQTVDDLGEGGGGARRVDGAARLECRFELSGLRALSSRLLEVSAVLPNEPERRSDREVGRRTGRGRGTPRREARSVGEVSDGGPTDEDEPPRSSGAEVDLAVRRVGASSTSHRRVVRRPTLAALRMSVVEGPDASDGSEVDRGAAARPGAAGEAQRGRCEGVAVLQAGEGGRGVEVVNGMEGASTAAAPRICFIGNAARPGGSRLIGDAAAPRRRARRRAGGSG